MNKSLPNHTCTGIHQQLSKDACSNSLFDDKIVLIISTQNYFQS